MPDTPALGPIVDLPLPRPAPTAQRLEGKSCTLTRTTLVEADALYDAFRADDAGYNYLLAGPFHDVRDFRAWMVRTTLGADPRFYTLRVDDKPMGLLSLMRHDTANGVIEVGNIHLAKSVRGTRISTEAQFLLMRYVFDDLRYRRYEWKCNALNAPSRKAAERLGFTFEGVFRQHVVAKGHNRDTAWYSMLDGEWPAVKARMERWLADENFDAEGRQKAALA